MKKFLSIAALTAMVTTGAFAMQSSTGLNASIYGGVFDYSGSSVMNYKQVAGATINKKINSNNLMLDLKYVYFDTDVVHPHKWDFTGEYSINNISSDYQIQVGGKLTDLYKGGHNTAYTLFAGINEKHPSLFAPDNVIAGLKVYYTDISELIDEQKITQIDISVKHKRKNVLGGTFILENTLTYQNFSEKDFNNRDTYLSDVLAAKLIKGKTIYMGHISFGHSALKIEKDTKYSMDISASVHKWGIGAGVAYKLSKNDKIFAKVRYNDLKTPFGDDDATEMKYVVGYSITF